MPAPIPDITVKLTALTASAVIDALRIVSNSTRKAHKQESGVPFLDALGASLTAEELAARADLLQRVADVVEARLVKAVAL